MSDITCTKTEPLNAACFTETEDQGLGPGRKTIFTTKWVTPVVVGLPVPQVWIFVEGRDPIKLADFENDATYALTWDFRKSIQNGMVKIGLYFVPSETEQDRGVAPYWIFSNGPGSRLEYQDDCILITFTDTFQGDDPNPAQELLLVDPGEVCTVQFREFGIALFDCCPPDCTRPYDNTVFATKWYDESPFSIRDMSNPGLDKQVFLAQAGGVEPTRGIALTRSADAHDENYRLLYGSQKWIMVWDLELNRLHDFFPKQWLRYGAAFYYQNQTLRKSIRAGKHNRKPYYVEEVDLGLVFNAQGAFNFDKDGFGQHTANWDVPSKLIGLPQSRQQPGVKSWGQSDAMTVEALYAEFNQHTVDAFPGVAQEAVHAQRERFFKDREMFLYHTKEQRHHDQIMFLTREVAEKTLRYAEDSVEQLKYLVDSFNPEANESFAYYSVVLLNAISNKMLKTKGDLKTGVLAGTGLQEGEAAMGDWSREIYGELRRLVEITKIEKKDIQVQMLKALTQVDLTDPTAVVNALKSAVNFTAVEEELEIAAEGVIAPGAGITDPDIANDNRIRGLAR